jgi:hypothetical protein
MFVPLDLISRVAVPNGARVRVHIARGAVVVPLRVIWISRDMRRYVRPAVRSVSWTLWLREFEPVP